MKIKCKSCKSRIDASDYNCPTCGKVNFYTDSELRAAHKKHVAGRAIITLAVNLSAAAAIVLPIGIKAVNYRNEQNKIAMDRVGYEYANAQCGNMFELEKIQDNSNFFGAPPFDTFYIAYLDEPDKFTENCITFCNSLLRTEDRFRVIFGCDEKTFDYNADHQRTEINFPCDISEFKKMNDLSELRIFTLNWTDENKELTQSSGSYPFKITVM